MEQLHDIVIVGGGLAAAKAAEVAREAGYEGTLRLVSDEAERPYERPPLSKELLLGEAVEEAVFVHEPGFYEDHDIDLRLDEPVTEIDRTAGKVVTATGDRYRFDRLLLATGARPRRLPVAGDLGGVHTLRDIDDSRRLDAALARSRHVTVVGAGWIGCEVAAAARSRGVEVAVVDPLDSPLQRVLGREVGDIFGRLHRDHGVDLRLGAGVSHLYGSDAVEAVGLSDGTRIDTELVVVGIGAIPNTELAEHAGLDVNDGVVTDAALVSSDRRILAAGDVARAAHPWLGTSLRVEHWANALNQGAAAGRNLVGGETPYERVPYFYSDQYDLGMEYSGHAPVWERVLFRGDVGTREFIAFWLDADDCVLAAMNCNVWDVTDDLQALIRSRKPVDTAALVDADTPLAGVTAGR